MQGWMKLQSFTDEPDAIFDYHPWMLQLRDALASDELIAVPKTETRQHGGSWLVRLQGCQNKEEAAVYAGASIFVDRDSLPALGEEGFYWHQLVGLRVRNRAGEDLGRVKKLIETGANDVLVLTVDKTALPYSDGGERLIPLLFGSVVLNVDLSQALIEVDWGSDY
ncbi:ribosome maturation factor RimM [Allohahella marinimesophila]|uniref:Ribosome maturation factor RimM n=1 Tax=Allohahella marinimesophila TaxID=1054972 RepID=A0ABP7Q4P3_9GAMM